MVAKKGPEAFLAEYFHTYYIAENTKHGTGTLNLIQTDCLIYA